MPHGTAADIAISPAVSGHVIHDRRNAWGDRLHGLPGQEVKRNNMCIGESIVSSHGVYRDPTVFSFSSGGKIKNNFEEFCV